jgi:hypothetical protein
MIQLLSKKAVRDRLAKLAIAVCGDYCDRLAENSDRSL